MDQHEQRRSHLGLYLSIGCGAIFVLLLLLGIGGYIVLAKTGIVGSAKNFESPAPTRVVEAQDSSLKEIEASIAASLLSSIRGKSVQLVLTEETLTALLRESLSEAEEFFVAERAQVAVIDQSLEVYVPLIINERETAALVRLAPTLTDSGEIELDIGRLQLGNLNLPASEGIRERVRSSLSGSLDTQLEQAQGTLTITELTVGDGAITIGGSLNLNQRTQ